MHVAGIGQCAWDTLAVFEQFPEADTKAEALEWHEQGGGPVATALVTLKRLGVDCMFCGVIGGDEEGGKIRQALEAEGMGTEGLVVRRHALSQRAFIAIEKGTGRRTIFWQRPTGEPLSMRDLPYGLFEGCSFLLLDGLMEDVSIHAAHKAKKDGVPVMLDAGRVRSRTLELAALCDYVVGAEEFARQLGFKDDLKEFFKKNDNITDGVFTITLGQKGSVTYHNGEVLSVPAYRIKAADTTGAGDVFHGAYVYGILQGWELDRIIRFASAAAALKCRAVGGRSGIPTLEEIERLMETGK